MELQKLRIFQSQAGAVGNGLSVAGDGLRVGGEAVEVSQSAGGNQKRLPSQNLELAGGQIVDRETREPIAIEEQGRDETLVVAGEVVVLEKRVVEGLHLKKAGLVRGHAGARIRMAAERALHDAAILAARPRHSPVFKEADFIGRSPHKAIDHVLVGKEIRALDRVPGVELKAVAFLGTHDGGRATLGADRMRAHDLHLRDKADVRRAPASYADFHRGTQPCQPGSQNQDIMSYSAHRSQPIAA